MEPNHQLRQFLILKLQAVFILIIIAKIILLDPKEESISQNNNNILQHTLLSISEENQMIDASFAKSKRVRNNNGDHKPKSNNTSLVLTQSLVKSQQNHHIPQIAKKTLTLTETPFLSFTSFQSYLQDCNQNAFVKKQHERLFRSQNKQKTLQNFNPKQQIPHTSQAKKKKLITYQDQLQISPFQTDKQIIFSQYNNTKSGKPNRNKHSKSQACNYEFGKSSSFAQRLLHQKLGTIEGWGYEHEEETNGKGKSTILRERQHENNKLKTQPYKKRSTTIQKPHDLQLSSNNIVVQRHNNNNQPNHKKIKRKPSSSNNKQNVAQSSPTFFPINTPKKSQYKQMDNHLGHFANTHLKRSINTANCLTEINELEEEILLSKRDDNMTNRGGNNEFKSSIKRQGDSNITRLKREAEYLCSNQQYTSIYRESVADNHDKQNSHTKPASLSIRMTNNTITSCCYANQKGFRPFSKFNDIDQNRRYNHVNKSNDSLNNTMNCSFQLQQQSPRMMRILQSNNPNQQALIFKAQTPVKTTENLKNNGKMIGTESDMKNASRNRQKFHQSMKQRKSKSAFNSICRTEKPFPTKQTPKINTTQFSNTKTDQETKFILTIVNSFNSAKNSKAPPNYNKNSLSMTKSIHSSNNNKESSQWRKLHTSESYQNENDSLNLTTNSKVISEFLVESSHRGQLPFQQIGPIQFGMETKLQDETQIMDDTMQHFQRIDKLSQEIKKMSKISTPASLSTKYNKKLMNFKKSIKNAKPSLQSSTVIKTDNPIQNLCISQLEGRKIHKLRKLTELNS